MDYKRRRFIQQPMLAYQEGRHVSKLLCRSLSWLFVNFLNSSESSKDNLSSNVRQVVTSTTLVTSRFKTWFLYVRR